MELITVHSSSHADNLKNDFRLLGEGDAFGFNGTFSAPEKKLVSILVKQTQNFAWVYIVMLIIVICLLMEDKSSSLMQTIKMLTFQFNFVSKVFLMDLGLLSWEKYL